MTTIRVKVKPNAHVSEVVPAGDGSWIVRVRSAPTDGKANEELIALIADHFEVARKRVTIRTGAASRSKLVRIEAAEERPASRGRERASRAKGGRRRD